MRWLEDHWPSLLGGLVAVAIAFFCVDCVGTPVSMAGVGTVVDKHHQAAYTTTSVSTDSKGNAEVHTEYHPDEYRLWISLDGSASSYLVSSGMYERCRIETAVTMYEQHGRLTGWRYLSVGEPISDGRER